MKIEIRLIPRIEEQWLRLINFKFQDISCPSQSVATALNLKEDTILFSSLGW